MADGQLVPELTKLLDAAIGQAASDLHLVTGLKPTLRKDGVLLTLEQEAALTPEGVKAMVSSMLGEERMLVFVQRKELDFSFGYQNHRFRVNAFYSQGTVSAALRLITAEIRTLQQLGAPPIAESFTKSAQGFVIVTGPTGHGKSTTLAALLNHINHSKRKRIITIEDPIEYIFRSEQSVVTQRELGLDTHSFAKAIKSSLREDPDVILVGEMRDLETIETALILAETGHLVFTTLHSGSAAQVADRIIDVFPPHQQQQIRQQLASVILGVVAQRLIPRVSGGRLLAAEIMMANTAIKNTIREGKTHQIHNIIQTSAAEGMIGLDKVLAEYVSRGEITIDEALTWALDPKSFKMMIY